MTLAPTTVKPPRLSQRAIDLLPPGAVVQLDAFRGALFDVIAHHPHEPGDRIGRCQVAVAVGPWTLTPERAPTLITDVKALSQHGHVISAGALISLEEKLDVHLGGEITRERLPSRIRRGRFCADPVWRAGGVDFRSRRAAIAFVANGCAHPDHARTLIGFTCVGCGGRWR